MRTTLSVAVVIALVAIAGVGWYGASHFYGVAGQKDRELVIAQEWKDTQRMFLARQAERIAEMVVGRQYQDALIAVEGLNSGRHDPQFSELRVRVFKALLAEVYGNEDLYGIDRELRDLKDWLELMYLAKGGRRNDAANQGSARDDDG